MGGCLGDLENIRPVLNREILVRPDLTSYAKRTTVRPDMLIEEYRLVIEYDGRANHTSDRDRYMDELRRNTLERMGYTIRVLSNELVSDPDGFDAFMGEIAESIGLRMPKRTPAALKARDQLRNILWTRNYSS